jgi:hypothetical protein
MTLWSFWKSRDRPWSPEEDGDPEAVIVSPYAAEFLAAFDRTEKFGFEAPPRLLVRKNCVDMAATVPVLLDYYERNGWEALIGQTAAIHFALVPLLADKTGIPFQLTIGWIERDGKPIYQHDESLIHRFIEGKTEAWLREGCPFHLWLTSPACEILDVTFAMNLGWAKTRDECAALVIYRQGEQATRDPIYHPTLIGPDFFHKTGGVL